MKGWEVSKLGDLLQIQNGFAFDSKAFSPNGEHPLIRIRDLKGGITTETRYDGDFERRYVVRKGDYLIGMDGEFGCYEWKGSEALLNQRVCKLHSFDQKLDSRFLFYGINKFLKDIEEVTGFTTVKHLSSKQIAGIEFPFAPLAEQRRIVSILDEAFAGLAVMRQHAEANLKNARALFDSHLNAIFSQRGEGWVETTLTKLCDPNRLITYGVIKLGESQSNGIPCLRTSNVRKLYIDTIGIKLIDKTISDNYARTILSGGELLVNVRGTLGGVAIVPHSMNGWNVSREIAVVPIMDSLAKTEFVAYFLVSIYCQAWLKNVTKGATYAGINLEDLRILPIMMPNRSVQNEIVDSIRAYEDRTEGLELLYRQKLAAIDELKQSILHRAFSGELSAKDALAA